MQQRTLFLQNHRIGLFIYFILHLTILPLCSQGQSLNNSYGKISVEITKQKKPKKIYARVEIIAAFPCGDSAWVNRIESNLARTLPYRNGAKKGKYNVAVAFIVSKDGSISDIRAVTDPGFGMAEEVIRAIKKGPKWIPAPAPGIKLRNVQ